MEATLAALEESERSWTAERVQREKLVEQARYEAERARRQFDRVEPENRLVARTLERAWERSLSELAQREADVARFLTNRPDPLNAEEMVWLERAGADLQAIWNAPTTTHRDRKQLVRCLISEVVVTTDRERVAADLTIIWVGGAVTHLTSRLNRVGHHRRVAPAKVLDLVRKLGPHYSNEQIAFILNAKRLRTGQGNSFTPRRVAPLRSRLGISSPTPGEHTFDEGPEWTDVDQAAAAFGVSSDTVRRWAREGFIEARQVMAAAPWRIRVTDELKQRIVPDAPTGWVRLEEAAARLGRSKQTILHWVQSGKLRSVQVVAGKRRGLRIELSEQENGLFADA
jgi:excisionase family DNA binding protein